MQKNESVHLITQLVYSQLQGQSAPQNNFADSFKYLLGM